MATESVGDTDSITLSQGGRFHLFFFFQAEDGIRDYKVTGVQTCALPIWTMTLAIPTTGPSTPATGTTIERLRGELPAGSLVGGAAAENHDLEMALSSRTPLVFGLLIALGFLLLLIALGSPLVAFVGVVTNLGSIAAAFGVAKLIFQDGHLSGLLNFH